MNARLPPQNITSSHTRRQSLQKKGKSKAATKTKECEVKVRKISKHVVDMQYNMQMVGS